MEHLVIERSDGIATVTLNRLDKKNALSLDLLQALADTGEDLKKDPTLRGSYWQAKVRIFVLALI